MLDEKLDFEQRRQAAELEERVIDDPEWAAAKIVALQGRCARLRTHETAAAHLLDQQLSPEERRQFKVLCDEIARLRTALEAIACG